MGTIDSQTKSSNGAVISGTVVYMQTADATHPGLVSTSTQTFAGDKSFRSDSTTAFQIQNSTGSTTLLTADTTNSNIIIEGANSTAVFGSELATSPTCSGTNWSGSGAGPYTHTIGSTTALSCTPPASVTAGDSLPGNLHRDSTGWYGYSEYRRK